MRKIASKIVSLFKHCNGLKSEIDPNGKLIKLRGERFALVKCQLQCWVKGGSIAVINDLQTFPG